MSFPHLAAATIVVIASPPLRPHTNPRAVVEQRGQHEARGRSRSRRWRTTARARLDRCCCRRREAEASTAMAAGQNHDVKAACAHPMAPAAMPAQHDQRTAQG